MTNMCCTQKYFATQVSEIPEKNVLQPRHVGDRALKNGMNIFFPCMPIGLIFSSHVNYGSSNPPIFFNKLFYIKLL